MHKKFLLFLLTAVVACAQTVVVPWRNLGKTGSSLADLETRSASDLTTGTLSAARLPAFSGGDVTSAAGSSVLTLANSGVSANTYGSVTQIPQLVVDAKGRITGVTLLTAAPAWSSVTGKPTTAAGAGFTNGATIDSWGGKAVPAGTVIGTTDTQTLTNKDLSGASNTYRAASTSTAGAVQLATRAETLTGTDTAKVITPDAWLWSASALRNALAPRAGVSSDGSLPVGRSTLTSQTLGTDPFSVSVVWKVPSSNPSPNMGGPFYLGPNTNASSGANACYTYIDSSGQFQLLKRSSADAFQQVYANASFMTLFAGKTIHMVIVRSATQWTIYVNGSVLGTSTSYSSESVDSTYLSVGCNASNYYAGTVSALTLYNLALAAADVQEIFELGGAVPERFKFGSQTALNTSTVISDGTLSGATATSWTETAAALAFTKTRSQPAFNTVAGRKYFVSLNYTRNSGTAINMMNLQSASLATVYSVEGGQAMSAGANAFTFTANASGSAVILFNNQNGPADDYTVTGLVVRQVGAIVHLGLDDGLGFQLLDQSSNRLHATMTTTGATHALPKQRAVVRFTTSTNGNQQILGQQALPANARVMSWTINSSGTPTVSLGNASGGAQFASSVSLSSGLNDVTLLTRFCSTNNLWVSSNSTATLQHTIYYEVVD